MSTYIMQILSLMLNIIYILILLVSLFSFLRSHARAERLRDGVDSFFNPVFVSAGANSLAVFLHELVRMPAEEELAVDFFLRGGGGVATAPCGRRRRRGRLFLVFGDFSVE